MLIYLKFPITNLFLNSQYIQIFPLNLDKHASNYRDIDHNKKSPKSSHNI